MMLVRASNLWCKKNQILKQVPFKIGYIDISWDELIFLNRSSYGIELLRSSGSRKYAQIFFALVRCSNRFGWFRQTSSRGWKRSSSRFCFIELYPNFLFQSRFRGINNGMLCVKLWITMLFIVWNDRSNLKVNDAFWWLPSWSRQWLRIASLWAISGTYLVPTKFTSRRE